MTKTVQIGGVIREMTPEEIAAFEAAGTPSTDPADYPLLPWQFKAMVMYLGKDTDIRAAINLTADDLQRATAMARYENASSYVYGDPLMQAMRAAVGLSEQDLADAWMIAKDLASA